MIVKRYSIYLANLDPTIGAEIKKTRPVVIVSDDVMNKFLETVVACPLTTKLHPRWRSRIQTVCKGQRAEIAVDQIRTISKSRLIKKLDRLPQAEAALLRQLITEMYGE
ncbi:MAG: type II toxin-antitoxin system PemK/MazF family toxin [Anaerolineales bacterium]